jgi:hypothetical protein
MSIRWKLGALGRAWFNLQRRGFKCTCRGDEFLGDIYAWDRLCPYHNWYARKCGEEYPYNDY